MSECVSIHVHVLHPREREHPGRRFSDWLSCWVLLTRVQLLCYVNTSRPASLSFSEAHTHTHAQRASATTINPCRAISHPVLDIAMYSKPSSNKTVREIQSFSWQCICLCHIYYLSSVVFYTWALRGSVWTYVSRSSCIQSISGDLSTLPWEVAWHHPPPQTRIHICISWLHTCAWHASSELPHKSIARCYRFGANAV